MVLVEAAEVALHKAKNLVLEAVAVVMVVQTQTPVLVVLPTQAVVAVVQVRAVAVPLQVLLAVQVMHELYFGLKENKQWHILQK
jgi:hypothetical protein